MAQRELGQSTCHVEIQIVVCELCYTDKTHDCTVL